MIICYSKSKKVHQTFGSIPEVEVRGVTTQEELAASIVEGIDFSLVFIHLEEVSKLWEGFLSSLKKTFPMLEICLLLSPGQTTPVQGVDVIEFDEDKLVETVQKHLAELRNQNRRRHQRFDWPLKSRLIIQGEADGQFRVRSISSSGAFLESAYYYPEIGKQGTIRIRFHDFNLLVGCQIIDKREPSGNLPAGFGVQFTDLTEVSQGIVDEMVQDELLRSLMEPDKPPRPPSII